MAAMTMGNSMKRAFAATLLAASTFLVPAAADAKPIEQYRQMSVDDRARYVIELLNRTIDYLSEHGQTADAQKVADLFNAADGATAKEFYFYLHEVESAGKEKGKTAEVEHAMLLTLRDHGINIPKADFMTLVKNFQPTNATNAQVARNDNKPAATPK
jgi:hypothetical protein